MGRSKRWKAYNTKHPEKYMIKEITRISSKFNDTRKVKVKVTKK